MAKKIYTNGKIPRKILHKWKDAVFGSRYVSIPSDQFSSLLKQLIEAMKSGGPEILNRDSEDVVYIPLIATRYLVAYLPEEVLNAQDNIKEALSDSFLEQLQRKREATTAICQRQKCKRVKT